MCICCTIALRCTVFIGLNSSTRLCQTPTPTRQHTAMRTRPLDLAAFSERVDAESAADAVQDILPSPPPAYHQLPEVREAAVANSSETSMDEQQDGDAQAQSHAIAGDAGRVAQDVSEDEADLLYSSSEDDEEDYSDSYDDEFMRQEDNDELLGQQDWDNVSGDLTKRYNRLKQHLGVLNHVGAGSSSTTEQQQQPLPAQNQFAQRQRQLHLQAQRRAQHQAAAAIAAAASSSTSTSGPASTKTAPGIHASKLDSSLAALSSRYSSSLNLSPLSSASQGGTGGGYSNEPSFTSNAATRKGGSERHQVTKDKSDRATTEQVLDDRTRLVLYKMLGRKRLERVEGCVSTGKEVSTRSLRRRCRRGLAVADWQLQRRALQAEGLKE